MKMQIDTPSSQTKALPRANQSDASIGFNEFQSSVVDSYTQEFSAPVGVANAAFV